MLNVVSYVNKKGTIGGKGDVIKGSFLGFDFVFAFKLLSFFCSALMGMYMYRIIVYTCIVYVLVVLFLFLLLLANEQF